MTKRKLIPYVNRFTGDVQVVTKSQAKKLSEDYSEVEFTTNEDGVRVMRLQLNGATVDVSEVKQEVEITDGNRDTE